MRGLDWAVAGLLAGLGGVSVLPGKAAAAPCDAMAGEAIGSTNPSRQITTADLARLRDVGRSDTGTDQAPAARISPAGDQLAVVVRRAEPTRNRFCQSLVVIARSGKGRAHLVPLPGQPVRLSFDLRGLWMPLGMFAVTVPTWSPDGRQIAVLVMSGGVPTAIIADLRDISRITRVPLRPDVIDLVWRNDGRALIYSVRSELEQARAASNTEALDGYHFDQRAWPAASAVPMLPAPTAIEVRTRILSTGLDRLARPFERRLLQPPTSLPAAAVSGAALPGGTMAWIEPAVANRWGVPMHIVAKRGRDALACEDPACSGRLLQLWADGPGGSFIFLRREGWGGSISAIYRWRPGRRPDRIFATGDLLLGCQLDRGTLLCERESSRQPRQIVTIDGRSGAMRTIFDPNPGFASLVMPSVTRLHWTADLGVEGYGDLVLPVTPSHRPLPLIVVGYRTRGFLRGAIGDEYPILPLAARGFAVLSLENTPEYATVIKAPVATYDEAAPIDFKDAADRRLILSSLRAGLSAAQATVAIDPARMAITGLSDAASTAWFALINTDLFSLASLSTPTFDPKTTMPMAGPALGEELVRWGYPRLLDADPGFWQPISPALNANRIAAPLLLQYASDEYLMGLEAYTALGEAGRAVDMYVYPGEHHVKWQPAHRQAVYDRNVDWFSFWFQRREDQDPRKRRQYERWRMMRDAACHARTSSGPDIVAPIAAQLCSQASTSTSIDTRR